MDAAAIPIHRQKPDYLCIKVDRSLSKLFPIAYGLYLTATIPMSLLNIVVRIVRVASDFPDRLLLVLLY